jgi:hypothetical protein
VSHFRLSTPSAPTSSLAILTATLSTTRFRREGRRLPRSRIWLGFVQLVCFGGAVVGLRWRFFVGFGWVRTIDRPYLWRVPQSSLWAAGSRFPARGWACQSPPDAAAATRRAKLAAVLRVRSASSPSPPSAAGFPPPYARARQSAIGSDRPAPSLNFPPTGCLPCIRRESCFPLWAEDAMRGIRDATGCCSTISAVCCSMISAVSRFPFLFPWKFVRGWRFPAPSLRWASSGRRSWSSVFSCRTAPSTPTPRDPLFRKAVATSPRLLCADPR